MPDILNLSNGTHICELRGPASFGRRIKPGLLFRSGRLDHLSPTDQQAISSLALRTIVDLRSRQEALQDPDSSIPGTDYLLCSAIPDNIEKETYQAWCHPDGRKGSCSDRRSTRYFEVILFGNPAFQALFDRLSEQPAPLLFHCATGIDLSGTAAMLVMLALGASERQALQAYLDGLPSQQKQGSFWKNLFSGANPMPSSVHRQMAEKELSIILDRYDTADNYLSREYHLNSGRIDQLREWYTEEIPRHDSLARKKYDVRGRVQHVGLRAFIITAAMEHNLTGLVENRPDGSVYVEAQGAPEDLARFTEELRRGNGYARITAVTSSDLAPVEGETGFRYHGLNHF